MKERKKSGFGEEYKYEFLIISEELAPNQIVQLIKHSASDPLINRHTSDGARFKDKESYNKWKEKKRNTYILTDASLNLLGFIWLGKSNLPAERSFTENINASDYGITFAIRVYEPARGKNVALRFMEDSVKRFKESDVYLGALKKGVWLEVSFDNKAAVRVYEKFGFKKITEPDEKRKILMVLDKKD